MSDATLPPPPEPGGGCPTDAAEAVLAEAEAAVDAAAGVVDLAPLDNPRRLLLVHAHPEDETIGTGATMAKTPREGDLVTLVTCTLGEEGEILVPELERPRQRPRGRPRASTGSASWPPRWRPCGSPTTASSAVPGAGATAG